MGLSIYLVAGYEKKKEKKESLIRLLLLSYKCTTTHFCIVFKAVQIVAIHLLRALFESQIPSLVPSHTFLCGLVDNFGTTQ